MRHLLDVAGKTIGAGLLFAAAILGGNFAYHHDFIKEARGQPTLLSPNVYFYSAVTAAQQIIGANPSRHALQICNSGATNALWLMPNIATINTGAIVAPAANVGVSVPPVTSNVVACFSPPTNAPSVGQAWQGFSTTTPVTVLEYP